MHISTVNISQTVTDTANAAIITQNVAYGLPYWQIYICPWPILKVKVVHISTANIYKMVTDMVNNTIAIKYDRTCSFDWEILSWPWPILKVNLAFGTVSGQIYWPSCLNRQKWWVLNNFQILFMKHFLLSLSAAELVVSLNVYGRTNGRTDERADRRTDEQRDGRTDERTDERTDGRTDGRTRRLKALEQADAGPRCCVTLLT